VTSPPGGLSVEYKRSLGKSRSVPFDIGPCAGRLKRADGTIPYRTSLITSPITSAPRSRRMLRTLYRADVGDQSRSGKKRERKTGTGGR